MQSGKQMLTQGTPKDQEDEGHKPLSGFRSGVVPVGIMLPAPSPVRASTVSCTYFLLLDLCV